ncbi:hypothetical protein HRbin23_00793 [bacterium HR23]|nr:hypothetical protein HRbin23_00793 [bacterium HR23]
MPPQRQDPLYAQARQLAKDWAELYQQFQQLQRQADNLNALLNARIEDIQALRRRSEEAESAQRALRQRLEALLHDLEGLLARPWPPDAVALRDALAQVLDAARSDLLMKGG